MYYITYRRKSYAEYVARVYSVVTIYSYVFIRNLEITVVFFLPLKVLMSQKDR